MTTIRPYQPDDLEPCRHLWVELTQHHRDIYDDPTIGGENPGLYFDRYLVQAGPERIWVAEEQGQVVGLAGLLPSARGIGEEAEVEPVVVAAAQRGRGIGRALLAHVVEEARRLGLRYLCVKPVARNVQAIALYYETGFRTLGEIEMFMELSPSPRGKWKSGLELLGYDFKY
jgi:GNAT superfamily N-acetyltransferase